MPETIKAGLLRYDRLDALATTLIADNPTSNLFPTPRPKKLQRAAQEPVQISDATEPACAETAMGMAFRRTLHGIRA